MAGSHEVRGSIPLGSTIEMIDQEKSPGLFPALRPNRAWRGRGNLDSRYIRIAPSPLTRVLKFRTDYVKKPARLLSELRKCGFS